MKRKALSVLALGLAAALPLSFVGCGEKTTTTEETTVSTPEGETTVTTETEVEQSGENPPPAE